MRAYIAVILLSAGLGAPALAEPAQPLVNVQQPEAKSKAELQRQVSMLKRQVAQLQRQKAQKAQRRAPAPAPAPAKVVQAPPPPVAATPQPQPKSSSWSASLLGWWRGEAPPPPATQGGPVNLAQQPEPAAAQVEIAAADTVVAPPGKKLRRSRKSERAAITAAPETEKVAKADVKDEKTRSKRRGGRHGKSRDRQVASSTASTPQADKTADSNARAVPPEPRRKPAELAAVAPAADEAAPAAEADSAVGSIDPAPATTGQEHTAALGEDKGGGSGEATWWQRHGNPVVFNFRDCVASYASREAGRVKEASWAELLIKATESDCRAPFDEMARILAERFGQGGIEPVMRELIDTTFLPAAKSAAAGSETSDIPPLPAIPDGVPTQ